jgi:predicted RNase H-like HicB family nuclease
MWGSPRTTRGGYSGAVEKVRVIYHHEPEGWWAESPEIAGWSVAGDTYAEVRALVDAGVEIAFDRTGVTVEHFVPADTALTA